MAKAKFHVIIICPAYNVAASIGELVRRTGAAGRRLRQSGAPIDAMIVVDDGSSDGTLSILRSLRASAPFLLIVHRKKNAGAPQAVLGGMAQAARFIRSKKLPLEKTIVVRMDADLEHQPEDLPALISPLASGKASACVGYIPFDKRSGLSVQLFNRLAGESESSHFLGQKIPQFCPGFYAVRADLLAAVQPALLQLSGAFRKKYGIEMLGVDFITLALLARAGGKISAIRLRPIEDRFIRRQPAGKLLHYWDYHQKTMDFLRANLK